MRATRRLTKTEMSIALKCFYRKKTTKATCRELAKNGNSFHSNPHIDGLMRRRHVYDILPQSNARRFQKISDNRSLAPVADHETGKDIVVSVDSIVRISPSVPGLDGHDPSYSP